MTTTMQPCPGEPNMMIQVIAGRPYRKYVGKKDAVGADAQKSEFKTYDFAGGSVKFAREDNDDDDEPTNKCTAPRIVMADALKDITAKPPKETEKAEKSESEANLEVSAPPSFKEHVRMNVPELFYKYIIGRAGATKKQIEAETKTVILIPKPNAKKQEIVIKSAVPLDAEIAKVKINAIIDQSTASLPPTHFISLPLASYEMQTKLKTLFAQMQQCEMFSAKKAEGSFDLSEMAVRPESFHITILMLRLYSEEQTQKAADILKQLSPSVYDLLGTQSLVLSIKGLASMQHDPTKCETLYAKVSDVPANSNRLDKVAKFLIARFRDAGFVMRDRDAEFKVHATVLRASSLREKDLKDKKEENANQNVRRNFDATPLLKQFGEFEFGNHVASSIHLSQRHKFEGNGYYYCVASISLP